MVTRGCGEGRMGELLPNDYEFCLGDEKVFGEKNIYAIGKFQKNSKKNIFNCWLIFQGISRI